MNIFANVLIIIAGILWTIETIPQIVKLIKTKETAGISIVFFYMCITAYTLFLTGNVILKNWSIVISHAFPFVGVITILFLINKYRK